MNATHHDPNKQPLDGAPAPDTEARAGQADGAPPAGEQPLSILEAFRRTKLYRDENGQAMVEMVIIAPFLIYLMVVTMYYWEIHDAQQDHFINIADGYWQVLDGNTGGRTMADSDNNGFGWESMAADTQTSGGGAPGVLSSLVPSLRTVATAYHPVALLIGEDFGNSFDFGNFLPYIVAIAGVNDTPININLQGGSPPANNMSFIGPPYIKAGLPVNNYDSTNPDPLQLENPFRGSLLGMASFYVDQGDRFGDGFEGGADADYLIDDPIPLRGHFRLVTGDWAANSEEEIEDRAGELSYFGGPHGLAVKVIAGIAWLAIPSDLGGLVEPPDGNFLARLMRDWYNRGDDYAWMPNKIDGDMFATGGNPLSAQKVNNQNQVGNIWR